MRSLVWFRSDLRIDDHRALSTAVRSSTDGVVGLFLICRDQWARHHWGPNKIDFVVRSVRALATSLEEVGIPLVVRQVDDFSGCADEVVAVMESTGSASLYAHREYEVNEERRDLKVEKRLQEEDYDSYWFHDQTVIPPDRLRTGKGTPYSVFTPFWRSWVREFERGDYLLSSDPPDPLAVRVQLPRRLRESDWGQVDTASAVSSRWPVGEKTAVERLDRFVIERIGEYDEHRDLASVDGTSGLSPYLAVGSLSIRRCLASALAANGGSLDGGSPGIATWIKELGWREFYRHVLVGFRRIGKDRAFRPETEAVAWRDDRGGFEAWSTGRTGVPFVDAGIRQLLAMGWMHNRLRMVTAMFLTKNLLVDWRLGERFFNEHLVDADFASNNGGWQWSASTGTDAAPYFRIFNPWSQGKRYDPDGRYIHRWVPELTGVPATALHKPESLACHLSDLDYPRPVVGITRSRVRALDAFRAIRR